MDSTRVLAAGAATVALGAWMIAEIWVGGRAAAQQNDATSGTPPRVSSRVMPEYSDEARLARINSTVGIKAVVGEDGRLRGITVSRSAGFGLDEAAVEAAGAWRFVPAHSAGKAIAVPLSMDIPFRLASPDVPTATLRFDSPAGASRPVLEEGTLFGLDLPHSPVEVSFLVDESGCVARAKGGFAPAVERIRRRRFRPAALSGTPLAVGGLLEIYRTY